MPICLWTFSSNGLPGILKEKDRVRCLPKGHLTLTEQGKGHGKKCCQWFISWPSYSKTCPAVSWFCSELHFRHTFLRTNIMQHCIRNFLPFPFITDKSVCTVVGMWEMSSSQVLLALKCELPHYARKSCLGRKAFGGSRLSGAMPPACPIVSPFPVSSVVQGPAPDSGAQQRGLQFPTSAPPPTLSATLTPCALAAFFGSYLCLTLVASGSCGLLFTFVRAHPPTGLLLRCAEQMGQDDWLHQ